MTNVVGAFALGLLVADGRVGAVAAPVGEAALLAVGVGFCGALTTFSTFALETLTIAEHGKPGRAAGVALANLVGALAAVAVRAWGGAALAAVL